MPGWSSSQHGHWIPFSSSSRSYVIPACIAESDRSSSHAARGVTSPQSKPSRFASWAMIQMSSFASPGGSSALRTRCTRRSLFVTVPSDSSAAFDAGRTHVRHLGGLGHEQVLHDQRVEVPEQLPRPADVGLRRGGVLPDHVERR